MLKVAPCMVVFFRLDGLLLFCIIMGLRSASSAIIIIIIITISPVKMCWQLGIWPSTTKYQLLILHLLDFGLDEVRLLLPITIASLPTSQKDFDWAEKNV